MSFRIPRDLRERRLYYLLERPHCEAIEREVARRKRWDALRVSLTLEKEAPKVPSRTPEGSEALAGTRESLGYNTEAGFVVLA
ncbi:MAG: hypothetical protein QW057_09295 [Candidatus Bathyarchaeia archaeon]